MDQHAIEQAGAIIAELRRNRQPIAHLPEACRPRNESEAYRIQASLHNHLMRDRSLNLGPIVGTKIGCTTPVMQRFMNIDHPCAGDIFEATVARQEAHLRLADFCRVGVECEIVVRLGETLSSDAAPFTRDSVAGAVAASMAGIEIVEDRFVSFRDVEVWTLAADDFMNAGCVLGPEVAGTGGLDLGQIGGRMLINGEEVGRGVGSDILGHPLEALAWLANLRAKQGKDLPAGTLVMLGSVVETKWPQAGDTVEVELEGLGRARAVFE